MSAKSFSKLVISTPTPASLKTQILTKLKELGEDTTSHGIPRIIRSNNCIIKIIWILLFLISISYCLYTIITSFMLYLKYETIVQTKISDVSIADFPAVTICNSNLFNSKPATISYLNTILTEYNLTEAMNLNQSSLNLIKQTFNTNNTITALDELSNLLKRFVIKNLTLNERYNLGISLDDMLLSCSFNLRDCSKSDFHQFWDYNYGNCYTFNGKYTINEPVRTSQSGFNYGLHMELFVGDQLTPTRFSSSQGIYLVVHNHSTDALLVSNGFLVTSGFETFVSVSPLYVTTLANPYSNCVDGFKNFENQNSTLYGFMIDLNITEYNQAVCNKLCFQYQLIQKCGCNDAKLPNINNTIICSNVAEIECLKQYYIDFTQFRLNVNCDLSCPSPCNSIIYTVNTHLSSYPSDYYMSLLQELHSNMSSAELELYLKKSYLKVIVNYGDFKFTKMKDTPDLTKEDLFGQLGGEIGLCIGASLLTLAEILQLIIELVVIFYGYYKSEIKLQNKN